MEDKIFSFLKERIGKTDAGGNVGKTDINDRTVRELAKIIAVSVSEESQIEEVAMPFVSFLRNEVQGNINSVASEAAKAAATRQNPVEPGAKDKTADDGSDSELKEKLDAVLSYVEEQKQAGKRKEIEQKVRDILKNNGADNEAVLDISLKLSGLDLDLSPEQLADKCKGTYNEQYKKLYGDGLVPGVNAGNNNASDDDLLDKLHQKILKERNPAQK